VWDEGCAPSSDFFNFQVNKCRVLYIFIAKKLLVARNRDQRVLIDPWELKM